MSDEFDAGGTQPGKKPVVKPEPTINLRCRNTRANCPSFEAVEIKLGTPSHHGQRLYKCVKCGHSWGVAVGGHFEF